MKHPPISALTVMLVAVSLASATLAARSRAQEPPQSPQTVAFCTALKVPIPHSRHAVDCDDEANKPLAHEMQEDELAVE